MKKAVSALVYTVGIVVVFAALAALSGCVGNENYLGYVSQMRSACFFGESKNYRVTAYSEEREYPLKADGLVGETGKFVILKITFKDSEKMLLNDVYADFCLDKEYKVGLSYKAEAESYVVNVAVENLPADDFTVTVSNVKVCAGAGFIVAYTGDIMTMPGLPRVPAAEKIDVDENGRISGLF